MTAAGADAGQWATMPEVLRGRAATSADRIGYNCSGSEQVTFAELARESSRLARGLASLGLQRGDRCAVILPTCLDLIFSLYGTQLCGAAPALLDPSAPPALLARRIALCKPRMVIADPELLEPLAGELAAADVSPHLLRPDDIPRPEAGPALPPVSPDDVAYLQFTSGTTGDPKAAMILHRNLISYLSQHAGQVDYRDDDVFLSWVPLFHDLGLVGYAFRSLYLGCPSYLLPPSIASLKIWLPTAARIGATVTSAPDFGYRYVTRSISPDGLDLSRLRLVASGGEVVRVDTIRRFEERFNLKGVSVGGYGQAEAVMCISIGRPEEPLRVDASGNVANGRPLPGLNVRIVDDEGRVLPPGEVGYITARGPSIFPGYFEDEAATRDVLRDGWLQTGDKGYLDAEGYLFILGRAKSMIKRGGSIVSPREVEMAAEQVPAVRLAAAIGVPANSSIASEDLIVLAEILPEDAEPTRNRRSIADAVAAAVEDAVGHAPAHVVMLHPRSIPRTANGKIQHAVLRELYAGGKLQGRAF
jgi:acyl-CoA synthetase (AMP-forming)/AMP-acid ligase II